MSGVQSPNSLALARGTIPRIVAAKTSFGWWKEFPGPLVSFDDTERLPCPRPPCPSTSRLRFFRPVPQKGIPLNTSRPDGLVSDCVCVCVLLWTLVSASISRCDCGYVWLCECACVSWCGNVTVCVQCVWVWLSVCFPGFCFRQGSGARRSQSTANLNLLMSNGLLLSITFTGYYVRCFSCSPPENITEITKCTVLLTDPLYVPSQTA